MALLGNGKNLSQKDWILCGQIFDLLEIGIHGVDLNGHTFLYNTAMSHLEDQVPDEVLGKPLLEAMPHLTQYQSTLLQVLRTGKPLPEKKQTYINAKGRQVVTLNSNVPIYVKGVLIGAVELAKDITQVQVLSDYLLDLQKDFSPSGAKKSSALSYQFEDIIGDSESMQNLIQQAKQIAPTPSPVLIIGETGTGKEMFAQSIHSNSLAKKGPFIPINCAALPENLLESLLFGTVKGSYTDAVDRPGLFEQAHQGTLLLDEIDSMPITLQGKILRVLQEKRIRRVGGTTEQPVDVRIIATMNQDPWKLIEKEKLREDLFYRISVHTLVIPPLRERPEDISIYQNYFLREVLQTAKTCSEELSTAFLRYRWPGNVRQLQHILEGATALSGNHSVLKFEHLPALFQRQINSEKHIAQRFTSHSRLPEEKKQLEERRILEALEDSQGNVSHAARILGISRQLLQYKLRKLNSVKE